MKRTARDNYARGYSFIDEYDLSLEAIRIEDLLDALNKVVEVASSTDGRSYLTVGELVEQINCQQIFEGIKIAP